MTATKMDESVMKELAQRAIEALSLTRVDHVAHSFSGVLQGLKDYAYNQGVDVGWINHHPITALFVAKLVSLSRCQDLEVDQEKALEDCKNIAGV